MTAKYAFFLVIFISSILQFIFHAVAFPFRAILTKYRANYVPRHRGNGMTNLDWAAKSYYAMMKRVWWLEGWTGMYNGFIPNLAKHMLEYGVDTLYFKALGDGIHLRPLWQGQAYRLFKTIIFLPVVVVINRAITSPYRLSWLHPVQSLRVLLSPEERRRPWLLSIPALVIYKVLSVLWDVSFQQVAFPDGVVDEFRTGNSRRIFATQFAISHLGHIVLCPFEVASLRLTIQGIQPAFGRNDKVLEQDESTPGKETEYSVQDAKHVASYRNSFLGLFSYTKSIFKEEGPSALFRGWWYDCVVDFPSMLFVLYLLALGESQAVNV